MPTGDLGPDNGRPRRIMVVEARRLRVRASQEVERRRAGRRVRGRARRVPQILFIVTYGRSGSTLLQGILNSIPGYVIRGENRWALYHLNRFHAECAAAQGVHYSPGRRLGPEHP